MKRVAILGGGPAGAFAAEKLAAAGMEVVLFDEKLAWEKPCGGGLTYKAYSQYPFLIENDTRKRLIHETVLNAPSGRSVTHTGQPGPMKTSSSAGRTDRRPNRAIACS